MVQIKNKVFPFVNKYDTVSYLFTNEENKINLKKNRGEGGNPENIKKLNKLWVLFISRNPKKTE